MSINNRVHRRFEAPAGKWVKVAKNSKEQEIYQLIDISRGGMSFVGLNADEFKRGDKFVVLEFKERTLKKKIVAVVRYVKVNIELPNSSYSDYKVGVEFLTVAA